MEKYGPTYWRAWCLYLPPWIKGAWYDAPTPQGNKREWCPDSPPDPIQNMHFLLQSLLFYANITFFVKMTCYSQKKRTNSPRLLRSIIFFRTHHEMGLQTSYRQKKTTILRHFWSPDSWYHYFHRFIKNIVFSIQKSLFWKIKKKYLKKDWRSRGQSPPAGWKGWLSRSI